MRPSTRGTQDRGRDNETKTYEINVPVVHETEAETKTNYYETENETKKWSRDHAGIETLTSLEDTRKMTVAYQ